MSIRLFYVLLLVLSFTACIASSEQDNATGTSSPEPLIGTVDITFPMSGAIIYSETLYLSGTANNIPSEGFRIELIAPDESVIAATLVQTDSDTWVTEIVHEYSGDPTEVTIVAKGLDENSPLDYDIESILLSSLAQRP